MKLRVKGGSLSTVGEGAGGNFWVFPLKRFENLGDLLRSVIGVSGLGVLSLPDLGLSGSVFFKDDGLELLGVGVVCSLAR